MNFKDLKREGILLAAKKLFLNNGIENTKIKDIAVEANVGEATVYRYFETKQHIAIDVAKMLQNEIVSTQLNIDHTLNGFESISCFYNIFLFIFNNDVNFFRYISEFDALYLSDIPEDQYGQGLELVKKLYVSWFEKGLQDGTLKTKDGVSISSYYYSTTHALLEMCKKFANISGNIKTDEPNEIEVLISIILSQIKN